MPLFLSLAVHGKSSMEWPGPYFVPSRKWPGAEPPLSIGYPGLLGCTLRGFDRARDWIPRDEQLPVKPAAGPRNACLSTPQSIMQGTYHLSTAAVRFPQVLGGLGLQIQIGPQPGIETGTYTCLSRRSQNRHRDNSPRRRVLHVPASQEERPPMRAEDPEQIVPVLVHLRGDGQPSLLR